jgi:hypothetical protein
MALALLVTITPPFWLAGERIERAFDFGRIAQEHVTWLNSKRRCQRFDRCQITRPRGVISMLKDRNALDARGNFVEEFQPFSTDCVLKIAEACDVATRPRHTRNKTSAERIRDTHEYDWDAVRLLPQRLQDRSTIGQETLADVRFSNRPFGVKRANGHGESAKGCLMS